MEVGATKKPPLAPVPSIIAAKFDTRFTPADTTSDIFPKNNSGNSTSECSLQSNSASSQQHPAVTNNGDCTSLTSSSSTSTLAGSTTTTITTQRPKSSSSALTNTTTSSSIRTSTTTKVSLNSAKINENKWQIIEGLKSGERYETKPSKFFGYILKRRKRPLKGWHKRYFCLENGNLSYAKSPSDMSRGKLHGRIDVGLSVISTKESSKRIDIDSESFLIFHLKVKKSELFYQWVDALRSHRLARQHEINYGSNAVSPFNSFCDDVTRGGGSTLMSLENLLSSKSPLSFKYNADSPSTSACLDDPLLRLQEKLVKLSSLLRYIEVKNSLTSTVTDLEGFKYKKPRKRFHLRRKKSSISTKKSSVTTLNHAESFTSARKLKDVISVTESDLNSHLSRSQPDLAGNNGAAADAMANQNEIFNAQNEIDHSKPVSKTHAMGEFLRIANEVNNDYRELLKRMHLEKSKLIQAQENFIHVKNGTPTECTVNNKERTKSFDSRATSFEDTEEHSVRRTLSKFSQDDQSIISMSEYYDAEEQVSPSDYNSTTSEEEDDDESITTDFSEEGNNFEKIDCPAASSATGRRTTLPSVQPKSDISLWSLLCKNIGKDLSKISMPVTINEPLNVLQRLCEELEYCELLDTAASIDDPCKRMLMMAAFAVSAYASSTYRAGHKPFNPLLGETFECVREDKGFRFISEQVSHHPPVSACYAEAKNYIFWQDLRVKSKFWGKSMEVIPSGTVNVILKNNNAHYKWNKITTCVHNLFKGERYVDNYGELVIHEIKSDLTCKITFEKASYWSSKKNEISGVILSKGEVVEKIFGRWNESVHCGTPPSTRCIWRPGAMPDNFQDYYGFSRFAMELNEVNDVDRLVLPPTDTRFRPDQRLLEEGRIAEAETCKLELEQKQRERRRQREEQGIPVYTPLWFGREADSSGEEKFVFNGKYWSERDNSFKENSFENLW